MSILVKGMEMPKDCVSCRWHARWGCEITGIVTNTAQGCPLVDVPTPHGRLIDADVFDRHMKQTPRYFSMCCDLEEQPTIIEAEEDSHE